MYRLQSDHLDAAVLFDVTLSAGEAQTAAKP
jgi:hypothetical protein